MTTPQYLQAQFERCMPLFIALGDPVRLSIIEVLTREAFQHGREGPIPFEQYGLNVNEITCRTSLSRPAISHHLKILKEAGLVAAERVDRNNLYTANEAIALLKSMPSYNFDQTVDNYTK